MRHWTYIIIFLVTTSFAAKGQTMEFKEIYIGTGFALGMGEFDQANAVLSLYDSQNEQEESFKDFRLLRGFGAVFGTTRGIFNFELGYTLLQQRRYTQYNDGSSLFQQDARLRMHSFHLGTGLLFTGRGFGFGFNVQGDYHQMNFGARSGNDTSVGGASYLKPSRGDSFGGTVDMRFYIGDMDDHGMRVMIKPYYSLVFSDLGLAETAELINGEGSAAQLEDTNQNFSHFGVKFIFNYAVNR